MSSKHRHPVILLHEVTPNEWRMDLPRITRAADKCLEKGISWMELGDHLKARNAFYQLIRDLPEHIDAYHHLALSYEKAGLDHQASIIWRSGIEAALKFFPERFSFDRDMLPWLERGNRPFLRAYHGLGSCLLRIGDTHGALKLLERMLTLNPDDHQGASAQAISCYFQLERPAQVLKLCRRYPEDRTEHLFYGRTLALFQLGRSKQAATALNRAVHLSPTIAEELVRTPDSPPEKIKKGKLATRKTDKAFLYLKDHGKYWQNTPGAIQWVRDSMARSREVK
jgi:tetratricopeptide (TPR) repeat protein